MAKTAQTCDRAAAARLAVNALVRSATVVGRPGEAAYGKLECAFGDTPGLRHDFVAAVAESCEAGGGREPWRLLADAAWRRQRSPRRLAADATLVAERLGLHDVADVQAGLASPAAPAEALAALFVLAAGLDGAEGRRLLTRLGLDPYAASHRLRYPRAGTGSPPFALARLFA